MLSSDMKNNDYSNLEAGEIVILAEGNAKTLVRPPIAGLVANVKVDKKTGYISGAEKFIADIDGDGINDVEDISSFGRPGGRNAASGMTSDAPPPAPVFHSQVFLQVENGQWLPRAYVTFDNMKQYAETDTTMPYIVLLYNVGEGVFKGALTFKEKIDPRIIINEPPSVVPAKDNREFVSNMRAMSGVPLGGIFAAFAVMATDDYEWGGKHEALIEHIYQNENGLVTITIENIELLPGQGVGYLFDAAVDW
ncbi:hypothetical protein [Kordiimonas sp.]|uniref:hypothetical protein n=1 Tax=Kordiimonas sp. TaxID=1970157 RepID=UPI003A8E7736